VGEKHGLRVREPALAAASSSVPSERVAVTGAHRYDHLSEPAGRCGLPVRAG